MEFWETPERFYFDSSFCCEKIEALNVKKTSPGQVAKHETFSLLDTIFRVGPKMCEGQSLHFSLKSEPFMFKLVDAFMSFLITLLLTSVLRQLPV